MINSPEKKVDIIYQKIRLLGEGAFGKAYLVFSKKDGNHYVIKQIPLKDMSEEEKKRTVQEAKILESLN